MKPLFVVIASIRSTNPSARSVLPSRVADLSKSNFVTLLSVVAKPVVVRMITENPPFGVASRNTVLVVLGDGRSNRLDPLPWAFEDIARRCRRVIWMVPEARRRWGTGDSDLFEYLLHVDVAVEAEDLDGLARGVDEILKGL